MWEEGGRDDFGDEGEEGGEEVCDRQVQDEVVHPTHLRIKRRYYFPMRAHGHEFTTQTIVS